MPSLTLLNQREIFEQNPIYGKDVFLKEQLTLKQHEGRKANEAVVGIPVTDSQCIQRHMPQTEHSGESGEGVGSEWQRPSGVSCWGLMHFVQ